MATASTKVKKREGQTTKSGKAQTRETAVSNSRIPSGIVGLDAVIEGGLRAHTATVIVGASGTGKSTLAMQYILEGLDRGEQGLYITLDMEPEQIVEESVLWGWDRIRTYVDKQLFFFATSGSDFKAVVNEQLPALVEARRDYKTPTRVVIDPLTPIIWAERDKSVQRELIAKLFSILKKIGGVVATVEQHGEGGAVDGYDASTPIFLADGVLSLRYEAIGGAFNRTLEIVKMRGTRHGEEVYPYIFSRGVGAIIRSTPVFNVDKASEYGGIFEDAVSAARREQAPDALLNTLQVMKSHWAYDFSPKEALEKLLAQHNIGKRR